MKRVITGEWDGQPISRPITSAEKLAHAIETAKAEAFFKEMHDRRHPVVLKVKDTNEQTYCDVCAETPGKTYHESGESGDLSGEWRDCENCEGTGMVDPQVEITKVGN